MKRLDNNTEIVNMTPKFKIEDTLYFIEQSSILEPLKEGEPPPKYRWNRKTMNNCWCSGVDISKPPQICDKCKSVYRVFHIVQRKITGIKIHVEKYSKNRVYDSIEYHLKPKNLKKYPHTLDRNKYDSRYSKSYWCPEENLIERAYTSLEEAEDELNLFLEVHSLISPIYEKP